MNTVAIKTLELENYRQYAKQKIDFKYSEDKNICIIQGSNGFGKSNIFNAINWCFFGVEEHLKSNTSSDVEPICNTRLLADSRRGVPLITKVKLLLNTPHGEKLFERKIITTKRSSKNNDYTIETFELIVMEREGLNWKASPYPDYIISKILPYQMRSFFFVDGERLRASFENIRPEDIKTSIFDLSHINLLQTSIDHLDSFKSSLRKETKDAPDLEEIEGLMEAVEKDIKSDEKEYKTYQADLAEAKIKYNEFTAKIKAIGDKDVDVLETTKQELVANISEFQASLVASQIEYQNYLFKVAPIILCKSAIEKTSKKIQESQSKGKYPPPQPHIALINHILKHNECICGVDLKKPANKEKRKQIENFKKTTRTEDIIKDIYKLQLMLDQFNAEFQGFDQKAVIFEKKIRDIERKYSNEQKKLKDIEVKLYNIDVEKIKELVSMREKYETAIEETKTEIYRLKASIDLGKEQLAQADKKYKQLLAKQNRYKDVKKRMDICDICIDLFLQVKEKMMKEIRKETNKYTKQYFNNLVTAKRFDKLEILENYKLLVEVDGIPCTHSLSAAEHLCLGYSFMAALRKSSGFLAPIIIDTPIARVDECYRKNVATWIKESLGIAQVVLLILDTEYTSEFRKIIKHKIGQEYQIEHNETKRISEVTKYGSK